nr:reactive chlorine resistance membrane protein RclC [Hymenobacter terricola]
MNSSLLSWLRALANLQPLGIRSLRLAIALVLIWIGGLKFAPYEADGIVPFVAHSPFMSFFYQHPADYQKYQNKEGELNIHNRQWHEANNTYGFAKGLGVLLIGLGLLLLGNRLHPALGLVGGILVVILSLGTLSFLITTPEAWVPHLGDADYGFPFLSGRGRLVIKDVMMLAGAVVLIADSARQWLSRLQREASH